MDSFQEYLNKNVDEDSLEIYCNGMINYYHLKGVHAETSGHLALCIWNQGHPLFHHGTKANLIIRQGKEEKFRPTLYIEPVGDPKSLEATIATDFETIQKKFKNGVESNTKWLDCYYSEQYHQEGHDISQVTQSF